MRKVLISLVALMTTLGFTRVTSAPSGASAKTKWATATSAKAGGGMKALVKAAEKEGKLNGVALPPTWANYGRLMKGFQ